MTGGNFSSTKSTSASVLYTLRLKRIEPCAAVKGTPMARITCEGSSDPEVQADPEEAQIPKRSRWSKIASPSTYSKLILVVLGKRRVLCPLSRELGMLASSPFSSLS